MFPRARQVTLSAKVFYQAALLLIFATFLYALQNTLFKFLPANINLIQIIFIRSFVSLFPVILFSLIESRKFGSLSQVFQTKFLKGHLLRGGTMGLSLVFYIMGCRLMPLPEVYALSYPSPFFVLILSILIFKERFTWRLCFTIAAGFIGVIIVLNPGQNCFNLYAFAPLLSGLFTALAILWGKQLSLEDSNSLIMVVYTLICLFASGLFIPFTWQSLNEMSWKLLISIGLLGTLAQWAFLQAFKMAPANLLIPFDYFGIVWILVGGYFVFHTLPNLYTSLGTTIIIISGLYNLCQKENLP